MHYDNPAFFGSMEEVDMEQFRRMLRENHENSGGRLKIKKALPIYHVVKACKEKSKDERRFDNPEALKRAESIVREQYPHLSKEDESYWRLSRRYTRTLWRE